MCRRVVDLRSNNTLVTINGTQLLGGGASVASVTLAGVAVAQVGGQSDSQPLL